MLKLSNKYVFCLFVIFTSIVQYLILQLSATYATALLSSFFHIYTLIGIVTILAFNLLLIVFTKKVKTGLIINSTIVLILSVVNHLTYTFHGTPFSFSNFSDFGTAMNVLSPSLVLSMILQKKWILILPLFGFIMLLILKAFDYDEIGKIKNKKVFYSFSGAICIFVLLVQLFGMKKGLVTWSWKDAIDKYGYLNTFIQNGLLVINPVKKPTGFSMDSTIRLVDSLKKDKQLNSGEHIKDLPNFILILNESFYDFNQLSDISGDLYWLNNFYNLDNAIRGYTVCPDINGGTNPSEYELLTSNSTNIINGTPFNILPLNDVNSIARYFNMLNYDTFAMHTKPASNYNRLIGYPSIGFKTSYFIDDFVNLKNYGKREDTDESVYNNLLKWYFSHSKDNNVFMYCLTYQNHQDYEKNDSNDDFVHITNDLGSYTDDMNEYLSSIYLSDNAFKMLIDELEKSDKDVVVAMCGDHKPPIEVPTKYNGDDLELHSRKTPFIIWSNNEELLHDCLENNDTISMIYFMPTILEACNMPLTGYYDFLINLRNQVPIISKFGKYYTASGDIFDYENDNNYKSLINDYYCLEYFNISNPSQRKDFFIKVN